MKDQPPLPQPIWDQLPPEAQAAVSVLVQSFERRIAELEERLNKDSTNSSKPPSTDPPSLKRRPPAPASGRKRGGQPGHQRKARPLVPPEQVRHVIDCKPPQCRWCHQELQGDDPGPIRHQVAEVPPVLPVVDEYRLHRLTCPRCRTSTCATLPPGVPRGAFGPRLRAILGVLAGGYRLGKRPTRQLASDLLGLTISIGMICRLERQSAAELEAPVEELRQYVREAAVTHIDETSWWQGRDKMGLWTAVTRLVTVFVIAPSRGADVAREILGTDTKKVVISDRLKSYAWIKRHQFCWAHLNRDFQAMIDRGGESAEVGRLLLGHSVRLFEWWHRVRDGTMARATLRSKVAMMRLSFRGDLRRGVKCGCAKTAGTCRDRADEQRRRAGAASRGDLPQDKRRDRQRGRESVRGADALGGGDLPPAGDQCAGLPEPVLSGPAGREGRPFTAAPGLDGSSSLMVNQHTAQVVKPNIGP